MFRRYTIGNPYSTSRKVYICIAISVIAEATLIFWLLSSFVHFNLRLIWRIALHVYGQIHPRHVCISIGFTIA
jgi:hypothetical protein